MKKVAEIMHVVDAEREQFIYDVTHLDQETEMVLWLCGVRRQQYFALNKLILMSFEYEGDDFAGDMKRMAAHLRSKGHLIEKRRKDVPPRERETTNWWVPVRRIGSALESKPAALDSNWRQSYQEMLDGSMDYAAASNTAYDAEDWTEDFHF